MNATRSVADFVTYHRYDDLPIVGVPDRVSAENAAFADGSVEEEPENKARAVASLSMGGTQFERIVGAVRSREALPDVPALRTALRG